MPDPDSNPPTEPRRPDGWELLCTGILRTEFGRRPADAVDRAIRQLATEEALAGKAGKSVRDGWWLQFRKSLAGWYLRPAFVIGMMLMITGAASWRLWLHRAVGIHGLLPKTAVGVLSDASGARWSAGSKRLKVGDSLFPGTLRLESGIVELTFASTAKVAVEGPAQFTLTGTNSMELASGKASTIVPKKAKGFVLKTPTAEVTDLGTRFGAIIGGDQSSEVDVFQGRVRLRPKNSTDQPDGWRLTQGMAMLVDAHGATPAAALPEAAFPQPNIDLEVRPQNCGFDVSGRAALGGIPQDFGFWSGPAYCLTGAVREINPANGDGMLQFQDETSGPDRNSEVWQLIDLGPYKKWLAGGQVSADLSAFFNRIQGAAGMSTQFGLTLAAFHGTPANIMSLWSQRQTRALALADKVLATDADPATWEKIDVTAKLPPETDFVVVEIRAIAPPGAAGNTPVFPGNYADLVDLVLSTPMRPSSIVTGR